MDNSDILTIKRAAKGDVQAFEQLLEQYKNRIYTLIYRMLGNEEDAFDVAQEVWLKIYNSLPGFQGKAKFSTWIYRIAANASLDFLRKKRGNLVPLEEIRETEGKERTEDLVLSYETQGEIRTLILALPPKYREILVLRDMQGFAYEEIGECLGISLGTVKSRLSRAREQIRTLLIENGVIE